MRRRYLLVTPCRNEAKYIVSTLETVTKQTVQPAKWVIIDDGSTDETPAILKDWASRFPYIEIVTRTDRGKRAVGPGVIEAFYDGLRMVSLSDYDYLCKLDADLELPPRYFERCMERMETDPYLGNVSGKMVERQPDGSLRMESMGDENAIGAVKFYRMACFREIGGFVREVSWDGIDGHLCRLNGWIAMSVDDPDLRFLHLRPMGSSQDNILVGRQRWGRGKYFMGSAWYYVLASSVYRMFEPPYGHGGLNIFRGYLRAVRAGEHRYDNPRYRRYIRRFELAQLVLGKSRAVRIANVRLRQKQPKAK